MVRFAPFALIAAFALLLVSLPASLVSGRDLAANSKMNCIVCSLLVGLIEQQAQFTNVPVSTAISNMCADVSKSKIIRLACDLVLLPNAKRIQQDYNNGVPPDQTCINGGPCKDSAQCQLWSTWPVKPHEVAERMALSRQSSVRDVNFAPHSELTPPIQSITGQEWEKEILPLLDGDHGLSTLQEILFPIFEALNKAGRKLAQASNNKLEADINAGLKQAQVHVLQSERTIAEPMGDITKHMPLFDSDNDRFSTFTQLRGSDWRGKDCDDFDATIYPGRKTPHSSASVDYNCNGIAGANPSGQSYEELFCSSVEQYGVISVGDSAMAHFSLPPQWLHAPWANNSVFYHATDVLEDEGDWPHCSYSTGHANSSACPPIKDGFKFASVYDFVRSRNLCAHRDYQNMGVNGARSTNTAPPGDVTAWARDLNNDQPALIIFALIGNDVCNGHHTFDTMTPLDVFTANIWASLDYIDAHAPKGSIVIAGGLVDGRILYETMHNRIHPIGENYVDFYNYLNCVEVSPCWGWMNSNSTVRNYTTAHAMLLNTAYQGIEKAQNFTNIQFRYLYYDVETILKNYEADGGDPADLIEPSDGFHPSQTMNTIFANMVWNFTITNFPNFAPINPNNEAIIQQFGANLNGY